jgi:hypothetical protein
VSELGFDEALAREVSRYMDGPGWDDEPEEPSVEVSREEAAERRAEHQAEERGGWW